ncbi:MAG: head GIN domain-containing protein [Bacteroidales bacterium]
MKANLLNNFARYAVIAVLTLLLPAFLTVKNATGQETRNPGNFNSINLALAADVEIIKNSECKVVLMAGANDLDKIETRVNNNSLEIKSKNYTDYMGNKVKIKIYMPFVESITVSGSGKIFSVSMFMSDELNLKVTGSGQINLGKSSAKNVKATITGSGNIELKGDEKADYLKLVITGSGSCNSTGIKISSADISITGSGSAKVDVVNDLNTYITGSGSVYYAGNPIVNATSTGSGKTKHM